MAPMPTTFMMVDVLEERFLDDNEIVWTFLPIQNESKCVAVCEGDVDQTRCECVRR